MGLAPAFEVDGAVSECDFDSDARREAPPMNPALSFSVDLPATSVAAAESCLERRFSLLMMDLKPPFDEVGEVGEVGSVEEGAVAVESRVGAVVVESLLGAVVVVIPVGAVGSSYRSSFPSVAAPVARVVVAGVATTAVPKAGPVAGAARATSLDFRCPSFARRDSSTFFVFSASLACFAAAFSSALRAFAALFSSSVDSQYWSLWSKIYNLTFALLLFGLDLRKTCFFFLLSALLLFKLELPLGVFSSALLCLVGDLIKCRL